MILIESAGDLRKRALGQLTTEVHRHRAGVGQMLRAAILAQLLYGDLIEPRNLALNLIQVNRPILRKNVLQNLARKLLSDRLSGQAVHRRDLDQSPFKLTNVAMNVPGNKLANAVGKRESFCLPLLFQNSNSRLEIRLLDVGDQSHGESRTQALLKTWDFRRRGVGGQDNRLGSLVKSIEGVEELFLSFLLFPEELNIVDEEHIAFLAELAPELRHLVVAHALDELVGELFRGEINDSSGWAALADLVAHRMQKVGLTESSAAVDEERVVATPGALGHGRCRRGGKLVGVGNDVR